ncbi:MAG: replication-associated recombination protein A [Thermoleophilia bacterium]
MARGGGPPQGDLFGEAVEARLQSSRPLAARMRPESLDEVVGQRALLGPEGSLRAAIAGDRVPSMVLYGPPGSGKTTLARVVAHSTSAAFEELSAVSATVADVRAGMARARDRLAAGTHTVLFLDEIHRFNRAQQDALLPAVEDGLLTLIGATTQNPWYEVNAALVSRMRVWVLEALSPEDVAALLDRATASPKGLAGRVVLGADARDAIVARAGGDARGALNLLEAAAADTADGGTVAVETVQAAAGGRAVVYDRQGDAHYDTISAFIKSLRGSDPDAAIYYLAVMLKGGEDPKFIARRLIVAASEDVGNADPRALEVAVAAGRAVEFVGLPEARIALAQATTYLALAPKSNASYRAIDAALSEVEDRGARRPPLALRDSSVANARGLGNGEGYRYPHDYPDAVLPGSLLPEGLEGRRFYEPTDRGPEGALAERLRRLRGDDPDAGPEAGEPF